jgi:hypothetical protein
MRSFCVAIFLMGCGGPDPQPMMNFVEEPDLLAPPPSDPNPDLARTPNPPRDLALPVEQPPDLSTSPDLSTNKKLPLPGKGFFISSVAYNGAIIDAGPGTTGLEVADGLCTSLASAASLGGTWKAWLSDYQNNAIDRIADVGPWYLVDGTMIFHNKANLMTSPIVAPLMDETGSTSWSWMYVWTGDGAPNYNPEDKSCSQWGSTGLTGIVGNPFSKAEWTYAASSTYKLDCSQKAHLYCIEQ